MLETTAKTPTAANGCFLNVNKNAEEFVDSVCSFSSNCVVSALSIAVFMILIFFFQSLKLSFVSPQSNREKSVMKRAKREFVK